MANNKNSKKIFLPPKQEKYEDSYVLRPLKMLVTIVDQYQGDYYIEAYEEIGVSCSFLTYGKGTAKSDVRHILGIGENKKDVVLSLVKDTDVDKCLDVCRERFKISPEAKGIAFAIEVDSVVGVLLYKFLTDTRQNRRIDNGK